MFDQQMDDWWFGILGIPLNNNPPHKEIPGIQTTKKTTLYSWFDSMLKTIGLYHPFFTSLSGVNLDIFFSTRMIILAQFSQDSPFWTPLSWVFFPHRNTPSFLECLISELVVVVCNKKPIGAFAVGNGIKDFFHLPRQRTNSANSKGKLKPLEALRRLSWKEQIKKYMIHCHIFILVQLLRFSMWQKNMVKRMWFTTCWKKWQLEHAAKIHPNTLDIPVCSMGTYPQTFPQHEPRIRDIGKRSCAWCHCGSGLLHKNHCGPSS